MEDLRPTTSWRRALSPRPHWTPAYLLYRGLAAARQWWYPDRPSLTPDAVRELEERLQPDHVGAEWGSGNSTRWFAARTRHLTSFETDGQYFPRVRQALERSGLRNVAYQLVPFDDSEDEDAMHASEWVAAASRFADESLDYALVDSSPRGCLCAAVIPKLRSGGLLILDNANWYLPPPRSVTPAAPGTVTAALGTPGSRAPANRCWPTVATTLAGWDQHWSSDGVQMTLIAAKP
jgi:hypothetical protein